MIRFLVDTSSDYSMEEIEKNNMMLVPIAVTIGEKSYLDTVELGKDQFFEMLIDGADFPKTAQPSPQAFLEKFEEAKANGDEVICITLASSLSGTYQSANIAKDMVEYNKIHIIDSCTATCAIRMLVECGRKLVDNGLSTEEIVKELESLKGRIKIVAGLDTLEFLYKGGRLNKAAATIGEMANLKPIISLKEDGQVTVIGKSIGRKKALQFVLKYIQQNTQDTLYPMYAIYSYGKENQELLKDKLTDEGYTIDEDLQIGSTIGAHIGPGAFGIIYVVK